MKETKTPQEHEADGEYEAAAIGYAQQGFESLLEGHFLPSGVTRIGGGLLFQSISCDCRANNDRRPLYIGNICRQLVADIKTAADDSILTGLSIEWHGDLALMLETDDPLKYYDRAKQCFQHMDWRDKRWVDEPDFMHYYWASYEYTNHYGGTLPENPDELSFVDRLERKRAFAQSVAHPYRTGDK